MTRDGLRVTLAGALALVASAAQASDMLLVANKRENSVSFINLASGAELGRVKVGPTPHEIAASPNGQQAAVVAYGGHTIDILDVRSRRRLRSIELGANGEPHGIKWLPDGRILVTTQASHSVVLVDPANRDSVRTIATGQRGTHLVAVSKDGARAYAANRESGTVTALDLKRAAKLRDISAGRWPEGIALTPDGHELWVADFEKGRAMIFNVPGLRRIATVKTGPMPIRVIAAASGGHIYTSDTGDGSVSEFDARTHRRLRRLRVSGSEDAQQVTLAFSSDGRRLYVAETARNDVAELDVKSGKLLRRLKCGDGGDGLAIVAMR